MVASDMRNSDRIMYDSPEIANLIWARVKPFLSDEVVRLINRPDITGAMAPLQGQIWSAVRLNERLRFLRYGPGEYFKPHYDGPVELTGHQKSFFTLHLYLNERNEENELVGGATVMHDITQDPTLDAFVESKTGRVLVFQQNDVLHSGQDVLKGTKLTMRTDIMYKLDKDLVPKAERMTMADLHRKS